MVQVKCSREQQCMQQGTTVFAARNSKVQGGRKLLQTTLVTIKGNKQQK